MEVNADKLAHESKYVCWIDIMGTKNTMKQSLARASNFILKFHSKVIQAQQGNIISYPLMDGVFITCKNLETLKQTINSIFTEIATMFTQETNFDHKFLIRGALAKGEIIDGCEINNNICKNINELQNYRDALLLGMPMIQAIEAEHYAPPFGIYIHESAREFKNLQGRYYQWSVNNIQLQGKLKKHIDNYFKKCSTQYHHLEMEKEKIKLYQELNNEYFATLKPRKRKKRNKPAPKS